MANKNVELMRGNPEKAVKTLAIPIMISMLLTASYNIIDGIWVAGLGQAAIAGIGFVTPGNGGSGILRGEGDMKRAMYAMIVSVVLNAILDPIFIYVLGLGSAGASLATIVSALGSASVILYWLLVKKDTYVNVSLREFKFDSKIAKDILKVGIPASMDMFMMSLAVSLYLVFISTIGGEYGIASFTSGQRLYLFAIMPLTAIGSAVAAVSGSAYGAKNGDYLSRAHLYGVKFGIAFGTAVTIILVAFAPQLATLFAYTKETAVLVPEHVSGNRKGNHKPDVDHNKRGHLYSYRDIHPGNNTGMGTCRHLDRTCLRKNPGKHLELRLCKIHNQKSPGEIRHLIINLTK